MPLSEEDKTEFNELERTFNTPGWALLVQGWEAEYHAIPEMAFEGVKTMEELDAYRVRRRLLHALVGLRDDVAERRRELEEDEEPPSYE